MAVTPGQTISYSVGAGGAGGTSANGSNGSNTTFGSLTAVGGGAGGSTANGAGASGGSGGGGAGGSTGFGTLGAGTAGQGNNGGTGYGAGSGLWGAGGGGGASKVGNNGSQSQGGNGGAGFTWINGTTYGGGGGGAAGATYPAGTGGTGGGGAGSNSGAGTSGTANTGGGGGGASGSNTGGSGGSGIVIINSGMVSTYDSMTDVPTLTSATAANYCVVNPLDSNGSSFTLTNGNLNFVNGGSAVVRSTMGVVTSGKFYFEFTLLSSVSGGTPIKCGMGSLNGAPAHDVNAQGFLLYSDNGSSKQLQRLTTAGVVQNISFSSTLNVNDIIQCAYDTATGNIWMGLNNSWWNSSGTLGGGNPSAGTGAVYTLPDLTQPMTPYFDHAGVTYTIALNCGQQPFVYTPPTNYVAINTFNL
jgi:hypothetical protein